MLSNAFDSRRDRAKEARYGFGSARCAIAAITMIAWESGVTLQAEEPITPIDMLLVNPSAFHRKLLKVEGVDNESGPIQNMK